MPAKFNVATSVLADGGEPSYAIVLDSPDPSPAAIRRTARQHLNQIKESK